MPLYEQSDSMAVGVIEDWCEFGYGDDRVYILRAVARQKDNPDLTHNSEIVYRKILRSEAEIAQKYEELLAVLGTHPNTFRIYLTVNARNVVDAYFNFQGTMNRWTRDLLSGDANATRLISELDERWKSALHSPEAQDDSYFMYDLDDVSSQEAARFVEALREETEVLTCRATPAGYHVLTAPFDYTSWSPPVEYDDHSTDGLLFIERVDAP